MRARILLVCLSLSLAGCGSGGDTPAEKPPAAAEQAPPPPNGPTFTLGGAVRLDGPAPERKPMPMSADDNCLKTHSGPRLSEDVLVGAGGGLQNVFVYLKSGLGRYTWPTPTTSPVLDQRGCMYTPRVLGVRVNQQIRIVNSDPTLHNVHALPQRGEFNVGMPRQGMEIERAFAAPEVMVRFKCDVHPWMAAYVGVLEHPFFTVTDAGGAWSIPNLPAGTYEVEAWHEKYGRQSQTVSVGATPTVALDFAFRPAGS